MLTGLNYIYPFYLLPAPLSPAVPGTGLLKGAVVIGSVGPSSEDLPCRTAAASPAQTHPGLAALQTPNELSSVRPGR